MRVKPSLQQLTPSKGLYLSLSDDQEASDATGVRTSSTVSLLSEAWIMPNYQPSVADGDNVVLEGISSILDDIAIPSTPVLVAMPCENPCRRPTPNVTSGSYPLSNFYLEHGIVCIITSSSRLSLLLPQHYTLILLSLYAKLGHVFCCGKHSATGVFLVVPFGVNLDNRLQTTDSRRLYFLFAWWAYSFCFVIAGICFSKGVRVESGWSGLLGPWGESDASDWRALRGGQSLLSVPGAAQQSAISRQNQGHSGTQADQGGTSSHRHHHRQPAMGGKSITLYLLGVCADERLTGGTPVNRF